MLSRVGAFWLFWQLQSSAADLPRQTLASSVFAAAKQRVLGAHGAYGPDLCSLTPSSGRLNFFLLWPLHPLLFRQQSFAVLESVLFHHPSANVAVVSTGLALTHFDKYLTEGYCVVSLPVASEQIEHILASTVPLGVASSYVQRNGSPKTEGELMNLLNVVAFALQVQHGGISLVMDGLMLNPFDFMLPPQLSLSSTAVFVEHLYSLEEPALDWAVQAEHFERSWLPRSHADRSDGRTILCVEAICPRALPAQSSFGQRILVFLTEEKSETLDPNQFATLLYRFYVENRPARLPFVVQGFTFDAEMVLLPFWVVVEPHMSDGWKAFGGREDSGFEHTQLFQPRPRREPTDWLQISTAKMWLPLGYGPPSARNIMPRSIVDLAMAHFNLGLMPRPYRRKSFGSQSNEKGLGLRLPTTVAEEFGFKETLSRDEAALPGVVGGFRTFRQVRVVGRSRDKSSQVQSLRLLLKADRDINFFCRREGRPVRSDLVHGGSSSTSSAFQACQAALRRSRAVGDSNWFSRFEICGSAGDLNAAVNLLTYGPIPGLGHSPKSEASRNHRLSLEELEVHWGKFKLELYPSCSASDIEPIQVANLSALLDDVEGQVTVIAHSAERCHLLDRLAESFRQVYENMPIVTTCECSEEELCKEVQEKDHATVANMKVVSVPFDYGLSRGKSLLINMTTTEFTLVLDDDFTHSFHSCIECMVWRMRSRYHALWRPFDILGFPVLEDERIFGAFRGQLRVASHQLFVEPMVEQTTADGCMRVDICPMVFLAKTARVQSFEFQQDLAVGEHEQFFYSNSYLGAQVAVCFDSSFPHFRVNSMSAGYVKRRERMPQLMLSAFKKLGFQRALYLFKKYDHRHMSDYEELLEKTVPLWYISHDTCGQQPTPPVPFSQVLLVVLSDGDQAGEKLRQQIRGGQGDGWLRSFSSVGHDVLQHVFVTSVAEEDWGAITMLKQEQDLHKDVIMFQRSYAGFSSDYSPEHLMRVLSHFRDFHFRWLVVCKQEHTPQPALLMQALRQLEPAGGQVLGDWQQVAASKWFLAQGLWALPRDLFSLLVAPEVSSRLNFGSPAGTSQLVGGLNAWLRAFAAKRVKFSELNV